jgi:acetylornithine deacetylase/succinyl-diaminopimelate desuccinylase-like protein
MPSVREQIEARRDIIVDFCRQLVQIRTVNPPGENYAQLCDYLVRVIRTCDCDIEVVSVPAERAEELYWADVGIITEPAQPHTVKMGHRGVLWVEITTRGRTAHGSVPYKGINAFDKMVKVAQALKRLEQQTISAKCAAYPTMEERQKAPAIMVGGVVQGGVKTNVVPDRVTVTVDRRLIPEETLAGAFAEIQRRSPPSSAMTPTSRSS